MANEIKWSTPSSTVTAINGNDSAPTLKGLANNGLKLGSEIDNATARNQYADVELLCRFQAAPATNGAVELYIVPALDGTNYSDGDDSTVPPTTSYAGAFPVRAVTTQQRIVLRHVLLPPTKFKFLVRNIAGQAMTATDNENVLRARFYNDEVQ